MKTSKNDVFKIQCKVSTMAKLNFLLGITEMIIANFMNKLNKIIHFRMNICILDFFSIKICIFTSWIDNTSSMKWRENDVKLVKRVKMFEITKENRLPENRSNNRHFYNKVMMTRARIWTRMSDQLWFEVQTKERPRF